MKISFEIEVPEHVGNAWLEHVKDSGKCMNDLATMAFCIFLIQNGKSDRVVSKAYLDLLFDNCNETQPVESVAA